MIFVKKLAAAVIGLTMVAMMPTALAKDVTVQIPAKEEAAVPAPQDDFYLHVNSEWLKTTQIPPEESNYSNFVMLQNRVRDQLSTITKEAIASRNGQSAASDEARVADLYACIKDKAGRDAAGLGSLSEPLQRIEAATNMQEYAETMAALSREYGIHAMIGSFEVESDPINNDKYVIEIVEPSSGLGREYMTNADNEEFFQYYRGHIRDVLMLYGRTATDATKAANDIFALQQDIAAHSLTVGEAADPSKAIHKLQLQDLKALYSNVDAAAMLDAAGIGPAAGIDVWYIGDKGAISRFNELYTAERLPLLKEYAVFSVLSNYGPLLSTAYQEESSSFEQKMSGAQVAKSADRQAEEINEGLLADAYGRLYATKYFSEQCKEEVKSYVQLIMNEYKHKLAKLDWMSEATKQQAMKKLDCMDINIGYPEAWPEYLDKYTIVQPEDGGCLINNMLAIEKLVRTYDLRKIGQAVRKDLWEGMMPQTVNAYYRRDNNSINFPAAILQAPFFDQNADRETNLGGVGDAIAHEITHSFDSSGAQYDEQGRLHNWWTKEDYAEFKHRQANIVKFYSQYMLPDGTHMNGAQTLTENIADLGAMSCLTDIVGHDVKKLQRMYTNYAITWRQIGNDAFMRMMINDIHSLPYVRTNAVLSSTDGFYEAFSVKPGDGMYFAPDERARLW